MTRRVADFLWENGNPVDETRWLSASAEEREHFCGQFAFHGMDREGRQVLSRDRLGVNKLFFYLDGDSVRWSNFLVDLLRDGADIQDVWSVPSGHAVYVDAAQGTYELKKHIKLPYHNGEDQKDLTQHAKETRAALEATFAMLAKSISDRRVIVTMSGGLDSTTIAALARRYFPNVTGVTFSLNDSDEQRDSEDARFAMRVAEDLDIPIQPIRCNTQSMMELLDDTLIYGQDHRDFNVHCGLVNAAIARAIRDGMDAAGDDTVPVLLTGDTMNELMADYSEVELEGRTYYKLPRMRKGIMRRFLVNGLDSGDREIGIFTRFGLDAIQPYALCAEVYAALPGELIAADDSKQAFVMEVMGNEIPEYIFDRPKVRAQAGDAAAGQGIIAAFDKAGIDQEDLRRLFADLLSITPEDVDGLIKAGFYRFTEKHPGRETNESRGYRRHSR